MPCRRAQLSVLRAVAVLALCITSTARADERTDARREFRAGMDLVVQGKYDEGISYLERAYGILPHPNVLYNIGLAHMYAGRPERAIEFFERYKAFAPPGSTQEVDALVEQQRANLAEARAPVAAPAPAAPSASAQDATPPEAEPAAPPPELPPPPAPERRTPVVVAPVGGGEAPSVYEERVVSASRLSQSPLDAPNATAIITAQDIRMSGVVLLSQLLRRVAGVEVNTVSPSHAEISIRGLNRRTSNKVLVLWDGRQIRKDFNASTWIDTIPILVEDIERIEIIRGPASALYGADAFSGVINIITRSAGEGGSLAVARIGNRGQYLGGLSFSGRADQVSYRASAGYSQTHNSMLAVDPDRQGVSASSSTPERASGYLFANGDLTYDYTKDGQIALGGNYQEGNVTVQGLSRLGEVISTIRDAQAYAFVTSPIGVRLAVNYNQNDGRPAAAWFAPSSVSDRRGALIQRLVDADLSWSATGRVLLPQTLTVGVSYRFKYVDWDWLDDVHQQHHIGAYLQDVIQIAGPLRVQLGARVDRHPLLEALQFSPRGSVIYRLLRDQSIRLSAGRAFRSPSFLESYLELQNDTPLRAVSAWGKGNADLAPESITSVELGYQIERQTFALEANAYYNWIKDAILLTNVDPLTANEYANRAPLGGFQRDTDAYPVSILNFANEPATFRQIGGELGLRLFPIAGLDVYTNYSIHDTSPVNKKRVAEERANEQQTSLHKVNGGVQYRAPFGLELSADVSWLSKQLWIEQVADAARGVRWQEYRVDPLVMVSARVGYRLLRDRLELGIAGTNLAFQEKRQHPLAQPLDTRVLGTAKVRF